MYWFCSQLTVVKSFTSRRTRHPSAMWVKQQVRTAFWEKDFPRFLLHDRDTCLTGLQYLGSDQILTAKASPWQNAYCERVIGSIRRECTDHFLFLNDAHLQRVLNSYMKYYNETRTHMSLSYDAPISRSTQSMGRIIETPQVLGLQHRR